MSIWKTAIACSLTAAVVAGQPGQVTAAPLPTHVAAMKAAAGDDVTPVYWRGWGWGFGGLAAGAIIGSAIASGGPYGYYGGGPYYGGYGYPGPGYGYGYAPAYYGGGYGAGYGYGYRPYYRPRPYYSYGYYRPRAYYRPYYQHYW
ncbi:hypothetical protein QA645_12465 [Bradyrhizobium sp. CIAT3101]|uniref:hypothetical protein n=1 Tax=Bradyrhizobium sp. CIAT3101 TaxID=439387 RepID=UPI0024B0C4C8|nr:hypothetical protein [Bradyrhizobium sp. CIAT3101]WFU83520.1 hypothetical protein QA645_12465 [Bradyrhizobium sp. CIAT3101]